MPITLYDVVQAVIVTSVVASSAFYVWSLWLPSSWRRCRAWLYSMLGIRQPTLPSTSRSLISEKGGCTQCSVCVGCKSTNN